MANGTTVPPTTAASCVDTGDTTWVLISTVLVLGMMPGLAFFEAGMLRGKNTLSIITQTIGGIVTLSVLWHFIGYSLVYGKDHGGVIGDVAHAFLMDVPYDGCSSFAPKIPAAAFAMFEMMFATITPLLLTGAFAERMKWKAFFVFSILWEVLVYYPLAHWIWGGGWLDDPTGTKLTVLDFAGGIVIHTSAGTAAIVCALVLGRRKDFDDYHGEFPPSNVPLACIGAALLWMGWFGFNAGSALTSGAVAASTVVSTQIAGAVSGFCWLMLSWWRHKPSTLALINGVIAGLAGVTPASGFINTQWTILLGFILGISSYFMVILMKFKLRVDDALDVSSVHGLTGALGSIFIGFASQKSVNPYTGRDGLFYGDHSPRLLGMQVLGVAVAAVWSGIITYLLLKLIRLMFRESLKLTLDEQDEGVDAVEHGEYAYHYLHPEERHSPIDSPAARLVNH